MEDHVNNPNGSQLNHRHVTVEVTIEKCKTPCMLQIIHKVCAKCDFVPYPINYDSQTEHQKAMAQPGIPIRIHVLFDKKNITEEEIDFFIDEFMYAVRYRFGWSRQDTTTKCSDGSQPKLCIVTFKQWYKFDCKKHDPTPFVLYAYTGAREVV